MKKVLLIMAAALMTMTQCRKQETVPATPSANTIKMTVTAGPGAKTNITDDGAITWTSGDKLYVSDGTKWLGSLTLNSAPGNASGTFTGTIQGIGDGEKTCHFFYLGHDNGMAAPTANTTTNAVISFASQDGSREGALKYHLGHGSAKVTVSGGAATGAVTMRTEIAIAHIKLKMDGENYTGSVTMDVSNTMTVSPAGTFSGGGNGITIAAGTSGDRYVTLIPTGTSSVYVNFSGSATGSMTFGHGIQANNLYGMENGIEVTLTAPLSYLPGEFSVSGSNKVKFSKGNLYYNGADDSHKMNSALPSGWNFYGHQYDCYASGTSTATTSMEISLFTWGYGSWSTDYNTTTYQTGTFTDWGTITSLPDNAGGTTWRTLTSAEWKYLLDTRTTATEGLPNVSSRYAEVTVNGVSGMLLFPDSFAWDATKMGTAPTATNSTSADFSSGSYTAAQFAEQEKSGVVFLPAAGYRNGTGVYDVGSLGHYCSSTSNGSSNAYDMYFYSGDVDTGYSRRYDGGSVRLVRSAS